MLSYNNNNRVFAEFKCPSLVFKRCWLITTKYNSYTEEYNLTPDKNMHVRIGTAHRKGFPSSEEHT
jgi:hypothetical protein